VVTSTDGAAHGLRVEHLDQPLGIMTTAPRLSWRLPDGTTHQVAYRLRAGSGWDTGRVPGDHSLLVPYGGPALVSSQRVEWQVKVWTDRGEHDWSEPAWFETGLLDPADWTAAWIEPFEDGVAPPGDRPAHLLRASFVVGKPIVRARLHLTAHGLYEGFLNGERVGDAELTPGYTQYRARVQVQTYDVTDLVRPGDNVLAVTLADGWFRGQVGGLHSADQWGARVALLAQLHLHGVDGDIIGVGTGPGWRSTVGHIVAADLIAGERADLRRLPVGWSRAGFDDSAWAAVTVAAHGYDHLVDSPAPPVRRTGEIIPVAVTRPSSLPAPTAARAGLRQVVDLGQNINGWVRLNRLGPAGERIVLRHGEALDGDGNLTTEHLRPAFPFLPGPLPAGMVDEVIAAGRPGEVFEPRRTTHGFRYVEIEGHPDELSPDDVRGVVVHSDLRRTGWFACSDERLNALHEAVRWTLRGNACDIPTDCPQRERSGWTGDWQLFLPTAARLYDVAGFATKWLRDVVADQWDDGTVANMSPCPPGEGRESFAGGITGSAGWGDAVVIVPWELYRAYGDDRVLSDMWPSMVAWLARAERISRTERHPDRAAARPEPAPHEVYLWDGGFHFGEWLAPRDEPERPEAFQEMLRADKSEYATAWFAHSAGLMARIATVLGRPDDSRRYAELHERVVDAWQTEFIDPAGPPAWPEPRVLVTPATQPNLVRALAFDLVPDGLRPAVASQLVGLIRAAGTRLGTGIQSTPYLLPVLADTGHLDVAYELLLREGEPGWLVMLERGATTIWERWNGTDAGGVAQESQNHYAFGAVASFLHGYVAGLDLPAWPARTTGQAQPDPAGYAPAYRRFRVRPRPGGGITWAEAAHESPYGRIEVRWSLGGGRFGLQVTVPPGTTAEVTMPDGSPAILGPGSHALSATAG
jgi:alpha-L-rhamnosidase